MTDSFVGGGDNLEALRALEDVPTHDEQEFTAHAQPGWLAWDSYSPELDFCRFVGLLQRMLQPRVVLETGVGIGRITRHMVLDETVVFLGYESDPEWRQPPAGPDPTPTAGQMAAADLVVLDSEPSYRLPEIALWAELGKTGSVCVVHDAGNGHNPDHHWLTHHKVREAVLATGQPGVFLRNPRGAWMGIHQ